MIGKSIKLYFQWNILTFKSDALILFRWLYENRKIWHSIENQIQPKLGYNNNNKSGILEYLGIVHFYLISDHKSNEND